MQRHIITIHQVIHFYNLKTNHILAAQRGKIEKNKKPEIVSIPKMLRDLRRAESDSELVFILTEKDILFLVQNVWDSRSAISYSDEVNLICQQFVFQK